MRVIVQRVSKASVSVSGKIVGKIGVGYLLLLGIHKDDTEKEVNYLIRKLVNLRIMADEKGKMNLKLSDVDGSVLLVSQFTLYADTKKGNRPSFINAKNPVEANKLYQKFIKDLRLTGIKIKTGVFGADMKINTSLDGPVTVIIDSKR